MWSDFLTMANLRPGYNLLTRPFSDLATRGTPHADLFALGFFFVPGILTMLVGAGLWRAAHDHHAWRLGALMVGVAGVFMVATGAFPQVPGSASAAILHGTMSQTCFAIASAAPLVLFIGSRDHPVAPPRRLWLVAGIAAFAIELAAIAMRPVVHYPDGLFQRPFTFVLTIWFLATGAWLLRGHRREGLSVAD
jgi:hypothetical membrane protein